MSSETAGRADPYWYEWFVGLIEVVDLVDPAENPSQEALGDL